MRQVRAEQTNDTSADAAADAAAETGAGNGGRAAGEDRREAASPWGAVQRGGDETMRREARLAMAILASRRRRDEMFGTDFFADPAWDMLLDLFVKEADGVAVHVTSLCSAAAAPTTTALRYIGTLCDAGLVERRPSSSSRKVEIRLSRRAYDLVLRHLRDTARDIAGAMAEAAEESRSGRG